jgi:hypothetical protein
LGGELDEQAVESPDGPPLAMSQPVPLETADLASDEVQDSSPHPRSGLRKERPKAGDTGPDLLSGFDSLEEDLVATRKAVEACPRRGVLG